VAKIQRYPQVVPIGKRRALWVVLCLVVGAPCAFLTIEGVYPIPIICLLGVVLIAKRWDLLPESLSAFGLGFTVIAARYLIPDLFIYKDGATRAYFLSILAVGIALTASGLFLRRPKRWFRL
jgi:hypothetical protein